MGWEPATMCSVAGKGETLDIVPRQNGIRTVIDVT